MGPSEAVHREGDIIALLQTGDDLIFTPLGVIFTEGHAALFQPVASVRRPYIGRGIGVHNIIFRQPESLADLLLAVVRLNVHVLAENEAGHVVELHIERVLGRACHLVAAATAVIRAIIALHLGLPIDAIEHAAPRNALVKA